MSSGKVTCPYCGSENVVLMERATGTYICKADMARFQIPTHAMDDYTDCHSYKELAQKYNTEKQRTLDRTREISQELEATNKKINETKSESFFKRMKHSSDLRKLEVKRENLEHEKLSLKRNYLSFLNVYYLSQCSRCHCHYCPYETLVKSDYEKWSHR